MNADQWQGDRLALYEHGKRLLLEHPDGPLPRQGRPLPDEADYYRRPIPDEQIREAGAAQTRSAIGAYFHETADYARLYEALVAAECPAWHELPGVLEPAVHDVEAGRLLDLGRRLTRTSKDRRPVKVGLALLQGVAEDEDLACISTLALLVESFSPAVVQILQRMPDPDPALWWIARRTTEWARVYPVRALCDTTADPAIKAWLLRYAVTDDPLSGYYAGQIAVSCDLRGAIEASDPDDALLDGTEAILRAMDWGGGMGLGLDGYQDAVPVLQRFLQLRESRPLRKTLAKLLADPE